ncbi:MAG: exodeoxyribonuclease V subunit gamma [Sediminibacterium sp.]
MSINLNVSNSLQPLSHLLAHELKATAQDPFVKQWIVTQTEGMNSWLKQTIAKQNGIAANINFCKPNDIITEIYRKSLRSGNSIVNSEDIRWCIYGLLNHPDFLNTYTNISNYYIGNDIKRIALSDELADLFDQYQIYRHDIIEIWNEKVSNGEAPDTWQMWLWMNVKIKLGSGYEDRVQMANSLVSALTNPEVQASVKRNIPTLHLFGIAVITPYYLRIFQALAQFIDIHLYLVNPCPEHMWMDYSSEQQITKLLRKRNKHRKEVDHLLVGNDLLLNWGKIIKESFKLLMDKDDFVNVYNDDFALPIDNTETLLKKIQYDIYNNSKKEERLVLTNSDVKDGSITINGAYTPVREVEILHNYLVELVDKKKEPLAPKDIVVLVSDIELYAPFIHSVFSNSKYEFKYNIADESYAAGNNLFTAIQEILTIDAQSFKVEAVLKLLESPYIRNRFKIKDEETLRTAARQAGIIFSMEGRTADDTRYVSWEYGLKKIMYGICMSGDPEINDGQDAFIPLDTAEGSEAIERVRLLYFVKMLKHKLDDRNQTRTISEWDEYLQSFVEDMIFQAGDKDDEDYTKLVQFTEHMAILEKDANVEISFEVFRHSFLQRLDMEKKAGSFAKGGITFCSLVPMRSIPFKVVAMLGMDFDKFPRKETALSFSIINEEPKPGDRNVKNNDKHLFLETLMSAQAYLYISYVGANPKDGSKLPASSLVDELIDYVARGIEPDANGLNKDTDVLRKEWVTLHPLHSFSSRYKLNNGLVSYLDESHYQTKITIATKPANPKLFAMDVVDINEIARFLQNPARQYLQKQFNVYYHDDEVLLKDHELFELDHLTKWAFQDNVMAMNDSEIDDYYESIKKSGKLPLSKMGKAMMDLIVEDIEDLRKRLIDVTNGLPKTPIDIQFHLGDTLITGKVDTIYGNRFINVCNSGDQLKYLLKAFVIYLGIIANGDTDIEFVFIPKKLKTNAILAAGKISQADAIAILNQYLGYFKEGHHSYFNFYPAIGNRDMLMISGNHDAFWDAYTDSIDDEESFTFNDEYLNTAVSHGFFGAASYEKLVDNVKAVFKPVKDQFPNFFKAPKAS